MTSKAALSQAIRNHCLNCMSGSRQDVENCLSPQCALYSFRIVPDKLDLKELMTVIHENCRNCIGSEAEISICTTDGSAGFKKCSLYDYRIVCKQSTTLKPKRATKPTSAIYSRIEKRETEPEPAYEEKEEEIITESQDEIKPIYQKSKKKYKKIHCVRCGSFFVQKSNRAKYCPTCANIVHKKQTAKCIRNNRAKLSHSKQLDTI